MNTISRSTSSETTPQRAETGNLNTPQATNDATQAKLVANAVQIAQERAVVAQKLEKIAAMEQQIKELLKEHKGVKASAFPTTVRLRVLETQVTDLRLAVLRLQPSVANPEKMAELKMQIGTLQSRLNDGGMTALERSYMESDLAWLEASLERELFMAGGSGTEYDFGAHLSRKWGLEAGTLRSAINDGGLNAADHETKSRRLALLEKISGQIEASFHSKDVLM